MIDSCIQLEPYNNQVGDKTLQHRGIQTIITNDGYSHQNRLPYISIRPFTDKEWKILPHMIWTSHIMWNPTKLARDITTDDKWI